MRKILIEKFKYWIKDLFKNKRNCRRFCVSCEFYDMCKAEENDSKDTSKRNY